MANENNTNTAAELIEKLNAERAKTSKRVVNLHEVEAVLREVSDFFKIEADSEECVKIAFQGVARKCDYPATIKKTLKDGGTEDVPDPYIRDSWRDNLKLSQHPRFDEIKKAYLDNFENWSKLTLGDLTNEYLAHIKSVSGGSVGAMRKKMSVFECLNKAAGSRDSAVALTAAREAQRAAELALANQRAEMREKLIAQGLNPADFGL